MVCYVKIAMDYSDVHWSLSKPVVFADVYSQLRRFQASERNIIYNVGISLERRIVLLS